MSQFSFLLFLNETNHFVGSKVFSIILVQQHLQILLFALLNKDLDLSSVVTALTWTNNWDVSPISSSSFWSSNSSFFLISFFFLIMSYFQWSLVNVYNSLCYSCRAESSFAVRLALPLKIFFWINVLLDSLTHFIYTYTFLLRKCCITSKVL